MSNLPASNLFKNYKHEFKSSKHLFYSIDELPSFDIQVEFDRFEAISLAKHEDELINIAPLWLFDQANSLDLDLFKYMNRFDNQLNTFVTGCYQNSDLNFELISYKYRRKLIKNKEVKWATRFNTSPNNTPFERIYSDDNPVYVIEGHHDAITAILLGLDFVMLPTASFKYGELLIEEVTDRNIIFLVEDEAAYICMKNVAYQLKDVANKIVLKSFDSSDGKIDLSDFCYQCNSIEEVYDGISY